MANRLKMAMVHTICTLLQQGWSRRRIARALGIDRETVARYAGLTASAQAPLGYEGAPAPPKVEGPSKPAGAPPGSVFDPTTAYDGAEAVKTSHPEAPPAPPLQPSRCEPYRAIILAKLDAGLSAKRIHQDLVTEHGFVHQYHSASGL